MTYEMKKKQCVIFASDQVHPTVFTPSDSHCTISPHICIKLNFSQLGYVTRHAHILSPTLLVSNFASCHQLSLKIISLSLRLNGCFFTASHCMCEHIIIHGTKAIKKNPPKNPQCTTETRVHCSLIKNDRIFFEASQLEIHLLYKCK